MNIWRCPGRQASASVDPPPERHGVAASWRTNAPARNRGHGLPRRVLVREAQELDCPHWQPPGPGEPRDNWDGLRPRLDSPQVAEERSRVSPTGSRAAPPGLRADLD